MLAQGLPSPLVQARYLRTTTAAINTHRETHPRPHRAVSTAAPHQHHTAPSPHHYGNASMYHPYHQRTPSPLTNVPPHPHQALAPPLPNSCALCLPCRPLPSRPDSHARCSDVSPGTLPSAGARAAIPSGPSWFPTHHHRSRTHTQAVSTTAPLEHEPLSAHRRAAQAQE